MKIAIVGGAGKMGQWLAHVLVKREQQVVLIDRDEARLKDIGCRLGVENTTDIRSLSQAEVIVVAVPIQSFEEAIRKVAPFTRAGQFALDLTSVKVMPVEVMHRCLPDCLVLGTHPVFGPGADSINGQNIVLTPTCQAERLAAERLKRYLEHQGAYVSVMTPEKHDELMAVVLGLAHYLAIVAGDTLLGLENLSELIKVSGPTFRSLLSFIDSVLHEDPALYAAIQMNLPSLPDLQHRFIDRADEWSQIVGNLDARNFTAKMSALRQRLDRLNS
jgi:prephenate dehydrogenase